MHTYGWLTRSNTFIAKIYVDNNDYGEHGTQLKITTVAKRKRNSEHTEYRTQCQQHKQRAFEATKKTRKIAVVPREGSSMKKSERTTIAYEI